MKKAEAIYERIGFLLEQGKITSGNVIDYARAHLNKDHFVEVGDPLVDVVHFPNHKKDVRVSSGTWQPQTITEGYGRCDIEVISSITRSYGGVVKALNLSESGFSTYGGSSDGWIGYRDQFSETDIWVADDEKVASMPVAWMAQRTSEGVPYYHDNYLVPLKAFLSNPELYQSIYNLCQEWIDVAGMREWFHK